MSRLLQGFHESKRSCYKLVRAKVGGSGGGDSRETQHA